MTNDSDRLSRRKILGGLGVIGGAGLVGGATTTSLLWDEEKFGNSTDPNVMQGGELDLKVDWEVRYYDWIDSTDELIAISDTNEDGEPNMVDQPPPIIELTDVKPGDVMEATLSAHVSGNPAFLGWHYQEHADEDNGITEPEDKVNGHTPDGSDGTDDILINNGTYEVAFGEQDSGSSGDLGSGNDDWYYTFGDGSTVDTLYEEFYFLYGNGDIARSDDTSESTVVTSYPANGSAGTTYQAEIDMELDGVTVRARRMVTLDSGEATIDVDYEFENLSSTETVSNLRFAQYVDYDVGSAGGESATYTKDTTNEVEYIWQFQEDAGGPGNDLYVGFTGGEYSVNHHLDGYDDSIGIAESGGPWNNRDEYPTQAEDGFELDDVDVAMQWEVGELGPGDTGTLSNSFITATSLEDFEERLEEEGPGGSDPESDEGSGDLDEHMRCIIWYDDGDNIPGEIWTGETDLPDGTEDSPDDELDDATKEDYVMEVGMAQQPSDIVDTDAAVFAGTVAEMDGADVLFNAQDSLAGSVAEDFQGTYCYQNSDTEYIGVLCWVPTDIPGVNDNIIQTDRLAFQFGFDAIQCRHNVGNNGMPMDGTIGEADAENNANSPEGGSTTPG